MILALKIYFFIGIVAAIITLFEMYSSSFAEYCKERQEQEFSDGEKIFVVLLHLFLWPKVLYDIFTYKGNLDE